MTRKEAIQAQAVDHAKRGLYDNAMCRNGIERVVYATAWANADSRPAYSFKA